eukprot:Lankesteria_metandrocarpae@DN484_c0_g1_i2.p2
MASAGDVPVGVSVVVVIAMASPLLVLTSVASPPLVPAQPTTRSVAPKSRINRCGFGFSAISTTVKADDNFCKAMGSAAATALVIASSRSSGLVYNAELYLGSLMCSYLDMSPNLHFPYFSNSQHACPSLSPAGCFVCIFSYGNTQMLEGALVSLVTPIL